ncbi:hypothetical protein Sarmat_00334 [Rickettsiales endosymbiont of Paramecium tredecaurelia]|uniref:tetratricopeptide repeat protein n=1 Tax=Candidatus Sarmatiella mevalonica TaxID=2770581 RepID=UPI001920A832|nr:tetratricopeptide repeat protein [Candidatus Sarmatiella mevalonica]MBL3284488.1 hypothetical protein [Candidatus Sarmatiella mevalonica]
MKRNTTREITQQEKSEYQARYAALLKKTQTGTPAEELEGYVGLGDMFRELGYKYEALNAYERAIALDRNNPELREKCGDIYNECGMLKKAEAEYSAVLGGNLSGVRRVELEVRMTELKNGGRWSFVEPKFHPLPWINLAQDIIDNKMRGGRRVAPLADANFQEQMNIIDNKIKTNLMQKSRNFELVQEAEKLYKEKEKMLQMPFDKMIDPEFT